MIWGILFFWLCFGVLGLAAFAGESSRGGWPNPDFTDWQDWVGCAVLIVCPPLAWILVSDEMQFNKDRELLRRLRP